MGGEGANSPWPKLIVVFDTNLLETGCKLGGFKLKVFLLENLVEGWSSCFFNICKLEGCIEVEAFKLELLRLEGCLCSSLVVLVLGDNGEAFKLEDLKV